MSVGDEAAHAFYHIYSSLPAHLRCLQRRPTRSDTRREIMPRSSSAKIELGDVGYVFRKRFDSGWFTGEVVEILPSAGELLPFFHSLFLSMGTHHIFS